MIPPINGINSVLKTVNRKNAFAPFVIMIAIVMGAGVGISYFVKTEFMEIALFILLAVLSLFGMGVFLFMVIKRPELLQSESYRLEEKKLDLIANKSGKIRVKPLDISFELLAEPKAIEKGGKTDE